MAISEYEDEQQKALMAAYRFFGQGDLIKFWLFEKHRRLDKWINYFKVYEQWFSPYRGKEIVFVEVGVQFGGSLQMWKNYFGKNAKIIGIDINPKCKKLEEERITVEIGSQEDENFWRKFKKKYPRVDILLDDGGHTMNQQIVTFREMFPHIKDGGLYMCEDCHTSYWDEPRWPGGGVEVPGTFIEFTKKLIDEINAFATKDPRSKEERPITYNTINISGLHFYASMVVAEKMNNPVQPFTLHIENS